MVAEALSVVRATIMEPHRSQLPRRLGGGEEDRGDKVPPLMTPCACAAYAGRRALVVEADGDVRLLLGAALARLGFAVESVETGVAAMSAARARAPDIVLFDLQLRDVPGLELAGWLRSDPTLHLTPMIAIGAPSAARDHQRLSEHGIDVLVRKPVSAHAVERTVRSVLG
jgi:DNA-binding response OmpR family regulator